MKKIDTVSFFKEIIIFQHFDHVNLLFVMLCCYNYYKIINFQTGQSRGN